MSFVLCYFIYCLLSLAALKRMKKRTMTHCTHCNSHEILHHILKSCSVFLNQGRYTWRHSSILQHLVLALSCAPQIYADSPGYLSSTDSTIPSHILPTPQRPDLVLLFPNRKIYIIELTISFDSNLDNAHTRKHDRYASLISDLRFSSYYNCFFSLEVGSRGFLSDSNYSVLKSYLACSI